jgi:pilus assembly protein CpaB
MNQNESRTLWISVGAAIVAVMILYAYTQERTNELTSKFGTNKPIVVALEDINEMETIDFTKLTTKDVPVDFVQPGAVSDVDMVTGRVALAPIKKGEQILPNKIMDPSPVTGLALQVAPGKRAITIPIDETRGVAKLLKPGDRIDLLAALDVGKGPTQKREVKTIMQNVIILATGLKIANELPRLLETVGKEDFIKNIRSDTNFTTITIEVRPDEAQNLVYILATSPGSLFMTLRHPTDQEGVTLSTSSVESVLNRVSSESLTNTLRQPVVTPMIIPQQQPREPASKPKAKGPFRNL